jgi:F0F1-type ATP synthase assembly protein I
VGAEDPGRTRFPKDEKPSDSISRQFGVALELPFVMVSAIVVGALFGFLLDRWLHTKPVLTVILGGVGFYAGLRDVLRRLSRKDGGAG